MLCLIFKPQTAEVNLFQNTSYVNLTICTQCTHLFITAVTLTLTHNTQYIVSILFAHTIHWLIVEVAVTHCENTPAENIS